MANFELGESMLDAVASMKVLADNLDSISLHSTTRETQFNNSRESLHSSSKYDSAFDSHYSEDTASVCSQVLLHAPCTVETHDLPSILPPPSPYRVSTKEDTDGSNYRAPTPVKSHSKKKHSARRASKSQQRMDTRSSPSPRAASVHSKPSKLSSKPSKSSSHRHVKSIQPFDLSTQQHITAEPSPSVIQLFDLSQQHIIVEPSPPVKLAGDTGQTAKYEAVIPSPLVATTSAKVLSTADVPTSESRVESIHIPAEQPSNCTNILPSSSRLSDSSSDDDLVSNDSTPIISRRQLQPPPSPSPPPLSPPSDEEDTSPMPFTPQVTIIYPADSNLEDCDSPNPLPRPSPYPKRGTVFYQDSLTPHASPLNITKHRLTSPNHHLPPRYLDSTHSAKSSERKPPDRQASILRRLVRKRGSFKEEGVVKRRLPVKRSYSDRVAYHIRKGWIDYEEDLDFISQPSHPRAVGRMIDKKAGKFHVVQLYKPPSGKYGIFISQSTDRKGVFISRFSDNTAAKFYTGLISPGDQIIRVDGKNLAANASVDYVYDLMTKSDSVIFTVIPVCSRPDW